MTPYPNTYLRDGDVDRDAVAKALKKWLDGILPKTGFALKYVIHAGAGAKPPAAKQSEAASEFEHPEVTVVFSGPDQALLLERGAELLLALEYLAVRSLRLDPPHFDRVRFDAGDYRSLRIEELKMAARVAAERVRDSRQPFKLNPMAARERRIVHLALQDFPGIRTSSEGAGEERQVVILPADQKK